MHIQKVKTLHGLKYAVVDSFTSSTKNAEGKLVEKTAMLPVEYTVGHGLTKRTEVAIFPLTAEGLIKAKEIQSTLKH